MSTTAPPATETVVSEQIAAFVNPQNGKPHGDAATERAR